MSAGQSSHPELLQVSCHPSHAQMSATQPDSPAAMICKGSSCGLPWTVMPHHPGRGTRPSPSRPDSELKQITHHPHLIWSQILIQGNIQTHLDGALLGRGQCLGSWGEARGLGSYPGSLKDSHQIR
jgi:hypothetical protein